jgi:hypothetical protein
VADADGDRGSGFVEDPVDCAALLATCAQQSTGAANAVVAALARAALDWLAGADVKHLRSTLLRIVAELD